MKLSLFDSAVKVPPADSVAVASSPECLSQIWEPPEELNSQRLSTSSSSSSSPSAVDNEDQADGCPSTDLPAASSKAVDIVDLMDEEDPSPTAQSSSQAPSPDRSPESPSEVTAQQQPEAPQSQSVGDMLEIAQRILKKQPIQHRLAEIQTASRKGAPKCTPQAKPTPAEWSRLNKNEIQRQLLLWDFDNLEKYCQPDKLKSVPLQFESVEEYIAVFQPLLMEELRAQLVQAREENDYEVQRLRLTRNPNRVDCFRMLEFSHTKSQEEEVCAPSSTCFSCSPIHCTGTARPVTLSVLSVLSQSAQLVCVLSSFPLSCSSIKVC